MTNEEIEKKAHDVIAKAKRAIHTGQIEDVVYAGLLEIASQAYEEAAQIADDKVHDLEEAALDCNHVSTIREVAGAIRTLKDSLVSVPVS